MTDARTPAPPTPADSWDDLVSVALVGTSRRGVPHTPDLPDVPGTGNDEAALALLDRAALAVVRRAAGHVPRTGVAPVPTAAEDPRPEVGEAATDHLNHILEHKPELLPEWLELVLSSGRRAAHASVPALLDRGVRDGRLRPALATVVGTRGRWAAGLDPAWAYVRDEPAPEDRFSERDWEHGDPGQRRRSLLALRATDPDRARELLTGIWPGLARADLRRRLLETFAIGLGPTDEDFLEGALDDRSAGVRGLALSLLNRLPDGAHAQRLRDHVLAHARPREDGALWVDPVDTRDTALHRDLALAAPSAGAENDSERFERVWALVTHAPLDVWTTLLGTDSAGVVAAAMKKTAEPAGLFEALANAAVVQEDAAWARALLEVLGPALSRTRPVRTREPFRLDRLLDLLPPEERYARVLHALTRTDSLHRYGELLQATRGPWSAELSAEVLRRLHAPRRGNDHAGYRLVCEVAALRMPPAHVADLHPQLPFDDSTADAYLHLRDTLRFRHDMHKEL
ncbi:DUF5691 domain-containing protein [Nocardiopsis sp. ATB16-24]|uniref:DUF5691 domain-containing protein n=1 Tax=Nocardiopsis sp. ATB16-24 TaxID=3019555 RepID=UPI0025528F65|nr:DUF5691 domain-containing protein [Nocardiopsis sp. ATB16-24]